MKNILYKPIYLFLFFPAVLFCQEKTEKIAEGILHYSTINTRDTLIINVLDIDLDSCGCSLNTFKAGGHINGLQTTSSMADSDSVIAAVNADFFEADGSIINNMISGGEIIKALSYAPYDKGGTTYSQIAFDYNNKPYIERYEFAGKIVSGDKTYPVFGINAPFVETELILYNSLFDTDDLPEERLFSLKDLSVSGKYLVDQQNKTTGTQKFLLYNGKNIPLSDTVIVSINFLPELKNIKMLSGGWPRLIKDGKNFTGESEIIEKLIPRFGSARHPRTGIGFSKDSTHVFLFAVDGRQSSSKGMSLNEFADLMLKYGVYNGLNFDGGGSTTMVIKGKVINNPSDLTGERKVGSALLIVKNRGTF